jgi:putative transposase
MDFDSKTGGGSTSNSRTVGRRSLRLRGFDYSQPGAYFVTSCVQERANLFGEIIDGAMRENEFGKIVAEWWMNIARHFPNVELDEYVVMPNHFHGIVVLPDGVVGAGSPRPEGDSVKGAGEPRHYNGIATLGQIMGYFKYQSTKQINSIRNTPGVPVWQRNYFEHVIRNEEDLTEIRAYVIDNPTKWDLDSENPEGRGNPAHTELRVVVDESGIATEGHNEI